MGKQFLLIIGFIFSTQVMSQTGIGTTTPHASAKLDVNATDKGFLPPRVALTSTNIASPINSPANGLMVFNTASAGASPFNVVPGYYYWDGTGQKWVSISTTVGNVQNQAIFRSTSNTSAGSVITSWNARFNNISSGDLAIYSLTEFTLSNGIYKIEWALPFQSSNTYNTMVLQEFSSGSWGTFRGDAAYASLSNGGNTDWGGGTYAADILDCSSAPKTIRIINNDGASRTLFKGVTLILTKLNPSVTTSTTADNLGNHIATSNIQLNNNYLSNDGGNEGIRVDNSGNVGIGTTNPSEKLEVSGNVKANNFLGTASSATLYLLEAYANTSYTLPGSYTNDPCRYSIVNFTVNVPSSWFNTSTYRFTPQKAGYWEIIASYDVYRNGEASLIIQKNGTTLTVAGAISSVVQQVNKIIYLNGSTDYITIANSGFNSNPRSQGLVNSWFQARWVGE
jgi:hypothetical protein